MNRVLIDGQWRPSRSEGTFRAVNPASGVSLPDEFPVSSVEDLKRSLEASRDLVEAHPRIEPDLLAGFLEMFAAKCEARIEEAVHKANLETALPCEPRLRLVEFPRMTAQLRLAAAACRERSWCRATIDAKLNIRSQYAPLGGPIVIFSPNNFPFAFNSVGGGDFAAAIASGNPVIAKANPGHPGTTRILAEAAFEALLEIGLPPALVQMVYHFPVDAGLKIAAHPLTGAVAFTGSRASGLRIKEAADKAGKPVYLEMSSLNPVLLLPGALEERAERTAEEFCASCTIGAGQFCTKPGLVLLVRNAESERFLDAIKTRFEQNPPGLLIGEGVLRRLDEAVAALEKTGACLVTGGSPVAGEGFRFANTLFRVSGEKFLEASGAFQIEAFGSVSLFVFAENAGRLKAIIRSLEGSLTGTIYSHSKGKDDALYDDLEPILRRKVGRLLNDKMPTGVAVSPAMNHGGPFPATGHPGFTSVGIPTAMLRFAALRSYDSVRPDRLPAELRDVNPTGDMWRLIDGRWTKKNVEAAAYL